MIITGDASDHSTSEAEPEETIYDSEEEDRGEGEQDAGLEVALCDPAVIVTTAWTGCGDGILDPDGEACDDGNILDNDGCSWDCRLEIGPPREPEPSPLVLPRYCDGRGPFTLPGDLIWLSAESGPVFWWSGSDYRVLFQTESNRSLALTLAACDRDGGNARILTEHVFEDHFSSFASISMSYEGPEVFFYEVDEENNSIIGYMSFDMNGDVRTPHMILIENDPSEIHAPHCWFAHAGNRSEIMVAIFSSYPPVSRVAVLDRASAQVKECKALGPELSYFGWCDNLAAEDGSGGYMLAYAQGGGEESESIFKLLVPEEENLPSAFLERPICSKAYGDQWGLGMDLEHDGQFYAGLIRCPNSDLCDVEPDPPRRVLARFDDQGNLAAAPAILPPDGCSSWCDFGKAALAFGEGTIGVFLSCMNKAYFHTLDNEGRYVGEPCDVSSLVGQMGDELEVIGLAWDGEGYGLGVIVDGEIRFIRLLPSS